MTNPLRIKWPTDTTGFLYRLKHAGVQAVEKQYGHEGKHEALMETLRTLAKHAQDRYEAQKVQKAGLAKALARKPKTPVPVVEAKTDGKPEGKQEGGTK